VWRGVMILIRDLPDKMNMAADLCLLTYTRAVCVLTRSTASPRSVTQLFFVLRQVADRAWAF
jgi:hypothetical protein